MERSYSYVRPIEFSDHVPLSAEDVQVYAMQYIETESMDSLPLAHLVRCGWGHDVAMDHGECIGLDLRDPQETGYK